MKIEKHSVLFEHKTPKGNVLGHEEFRDAMKRLHVKSRDEWVQFEVLSSYVGPPAWTPPVSSSSSRFARRFGRCFAGPRPASRKSR